MLILPFLKTFKTTLSKSLIKKVLKLFREVSLVDRLSEYWYPKYEIIFYFEFGYKNPKYD